MRIRGVVENYSGGNAFSKEVRDLNGFLGFIMSADAAVLEENEPVAVIKEDKSFVIYSVRNDETGEVVFDAGTNTITETFRSFIKIARFIFKHPELLE